MTPEEIEDEMHWLAQHGEGADKRWALNRLQPTEHGLALEKPKTEEEIQDRISRLLKGVGVESSKRAFGKAHPHHTPPGWTAAKRNKTSKYLPNTLTGLYEMFPEAEKEILTGAPPGYPAGKGATALQRRRFIEDYAHKLNQAREPAMKGTDASSREALEERDEDGAPSA